MKRQLPKFTDARALQRKAEKIFEAALPANHRLGRFPQVLQETEHFHRPGCWALPEAPAKTIPAKKESQNMATRESSGNSLLDFLKHPLLLLVVGSIIGWILIPKISEQTSRTNAVQDARLRKAVEIVDNNTVTISQLNAIRTRLGMFHGDNVRLKPPTC